MPSLTDLTGKPHLSYSAMDAYLTCGERYRLERVVSVPQAPAWWFIGGSAFHTATELLDTGEVGNVSDAWVRGWDEAYTHALKDVEDDTIVRAGGRATKEYPNRENKKWWQDKGPGMVQDYLDWRINTGWQLTGPEAVEIPFEISIDGTEIKGYIDRLYVDGNGQYVVVDLKTGSREPASPLQLATYRLGLAEAWDIDVTIGGYYMARKGQVGTRYSLTHYTRDRLSAWYNRARTAIEQELFVPHVTSLCQTCSVAAHCVAVGGTPHASDMLYQITRANEGA